MSDEGPKTMSAREDPEKVVMTREMAEEQGMSLSNVIRKSAELYRTDETFRQGLKQYHEGNVGSLKEFYDAEEEALEDMVAALQDAATGLDPEAVDETLAGLMEGLEERNEPAVYEAARDFGKLDSDLGVTTAMYAGKFADDYWQTKLE